VIDRFKTNIKVDHKGRNISVHPNDSTQMPQYNNYKGNVYFIQNAYCSSTATDFLSIAKHHNRGVFVGEETDGGYYGNTSGWNDVLKLPNTGICFNMSFVEYQNAVIGSTNPYGRGIIPDYEINRNIDDIVKRFDTQLKFTIDLIKRKQ
jgi:hypothetical protein